MKAFGLMKDKKDAKKIAFTSFTSSLGHHANYKHLLNKLNLTDIANAGGKKVLDHARFKVTSEAHSRLKQLLKTQKVGLTLSGTIGNYSNFVNKNHDSITYCNMSRSVQSSKGRSYFTHYQYGVANSNRLANKLKCSDGILKKRIDMMNTEKDFRTAKKRRYLTLSGGANQKNFSFLLEDSLFVVSDFEKLYKVQQLKFKNTQTKSQIYGDIFDTVQDLTIRSQTEFYDMRVKLHLVAIKDFTLDIRSILKNTFHEDPSIVITDDVRIPSEKQLSKLKIEGNFRSNVLTDMTTKLTDSQYFSDHCKIVTTFERVLKPGDKCKLNIQHFFGKGLDLNKIFDIRKQIELTSESTKNVPTSFIMILESEGDSNACLTRINDGANFDVYSPFKYTVKFKKSIKLLQKDTFDTEGPSHGDIFTTTRILKDESDFITTDMKEYFIEDRKTYFNANYETISIDPANFKKSCKYLLNYDQPNYSTVLDPDRVKAKIDNVLMDGINAGINKALETETKMTSDLDTNSTETYTNSTDVNETDSADL